MKNTLLTVTAIAALSISCGTSKNTTETSDNSSDDPEITAYKILGESSENALGPYVFGMSIDEVKTLHHGKLTNDDDEMISFEHPIHHIEVDWEFWFDEGYGLVDIDIIIASDKESGPAIYEDLVDHIWMKYGRDQDHGDHEHASWEDNSMKGNTAIRIDESGIITLDISHYDY